MENDPFEIVKSLVWAETYAVKPENPCITLNLNGKWIMKMTEKEIIFNRGDYPDWKPDDFAKQIMLMLNNLWIKRKSLLDQGVNELNSENT